MKRFICILSCIIIVLSLASCSGNIATARKYLEQGKKNEAIELLTKLADGGNDKAMNELGVVYQNDNLFKSAREMFEKACEKNNADAYCNLGSLYYKGLGIDQDYAKAMELFQKASELGSGEAMYNIGDMYDHGCGVKQDRSEAISWYLKSSKAGYEKANEQL